MADYDRLPATQKLVLSLLAARYRLGEELWTLESDPNIVKAVEGLADAGLVRSTHGVVEHTVRAGLTDSGRALMLNPGYRPPAQAFRAAERAALGDAADSLADDARSIGLPGEYVARVQRWLRSRRTGSA